MEKKETETTAAQPQTAGTASKAEKKQKILLIALIIAIVLAGACLVTALVLKHRTPDTNGSTTAPAGVSTTAADTQEATTAAGGEAEGTAYVKDAYKADYQKIASYGIKGEPDARIKACFFNLTKGASPDLEMKDFNLLKVYEAFRIYDTTGTTNADGTKNYLLFVYAEGGKAVVTNYEEYADEAERADLLTEYIEELDKDYERHVLYANALEGDYILYE